jgi:hypothetical protein
VDARLDGPRPAHAPRSCVLLRRTVAPEVGRDDDHAELRRDGRDHDRVVHRRLLALLQRRLGPVLRQPGHPLLLPRRRWDSGDLRHSDPCLRGLPRHVRGHHAGAHDGRVRRSHPLRALPRLHRPLDHSRLRALLPLGVGRRLDGSLGRLGLCGRHRRAHDRRLLGPRCRPLPWLAHEDRQAEAHQRAAQHPLCRPRHGAPLVRLVWLQWRLSLRVRRGRRLCGGQLGDRRVDGALRLDDHRLDQDEEALPRRRLRRRDRR